jgi:periplasmic protein TonB
MSVQSLSFAYDRRESLGPTVLLSVVLHVLLFLSAVGYAAYGKHIFGGGWGQKWGTGGATRVGVVTSLPGVPLPAPLVANRNTLATQNLGLHQTEPEPKPQPEPKAQEIPKFKEAVKPEKAERINKRIQKEKPETPENAIPYGLGGKPAMNYAPVVSAAGEGGIRLGEGGSFGDRYSWYVAAVRNRISSNWLLATISPSILTAPRVYVTFEIQRDGTITNVQITQSSGVPEVDRSALRAVLASNPLAPLPPDYSGSTVKVEFYFDFHRGR